MRLHYRKPFNYAGLLFFYRHHQVGPLEWFEGQTMCRIAEYRGELAEVRISNDPKNSCLIVEVDSKNSALKAYVHGKVARMFDLEANPQAIAKSLGVDAKVRTILKKHKGVRLPSGWDPFEILMMTILGQLVTVSFGRALVSQLIELAGRPTRWREAKVKLFPRPQDVLAADLSLLKTTRMRRETLRRVAQAIVDGSLSLASDQDPRELRQALLKIKGIGPWTADYVVLKMLRDPDRYPATDLILARVFTKHPEDCIAKMKPYRGYAAALFWLEYAESLKKGSNYGDKENQEEISDPRG